MLRVLGIDVGTAIVGWSVIEHDSTQRNQMRLIDYGVVTTGSKTPMPQRLNEIFAGLQDIVAKTKPNHMAVESLFFFKNQKTVMTVSQARGVILLVGEIAGLDIYEYTPLQVKTGVTGYGRAEKAQVQKMVKMILSLDEIPKPDDAADALAIAINHLNVLPASTKSMF